MDKQFTVLRGDEQRNSKKTLALGSPFVSMSTSLVKIVLGGTAALLVIRRGGLQLFRGIYSVRAISEQTAT